MSSKLSRSDYSSIPEELLHLIFKRLKHPRDVFRFEAVCKLWKSVARQARSQQRFVSKFSPMLFAPGNEGSVSRYKFCNTTQGWLVAKRSNSSISFINPLSGSYVPLAPSLITKAVASCSPLDPNCTVLAITDGRPPLMFCNPHEGTWRVFRKVTGYFSDIIYYKKNFYVMEITGQVLLCDLWTEPKVINFAPSTQLWECLNRKHLVESSGDILQVIRLVVPRFIIEFELLKLDFNARKWIPVTSLGDNSLLWSENQCLSVSSKDFPDFKCDCIYFVERQKDGYFLRTFDLKSRRYETILKLSGTLSSYHWFTPDIMLR